MSKDPDFPDFPESEEEIMRLARAMIEGLRAHPDMFPDPPATPEVLEQAVNRFLNARESEVVHLARAERAVAAMHRSLDAVVDMLRTSTPGAESHGRGPAPTEAPGQVGFLELVDQGGGTASFAWQAPRDGGAVLLYWIQRREPDSAGEWKSVSASIVPEATVAEQETGVALEFQVVAVNHIGEGPASNTVSTVLG